MFYAHFKPFLAHKTRGKTTLNFYGINYEGISLESLKYTPGGSLAFFIKLLYSTTILGSVDNLSFLKKETLSEYLYPFTVRTFEVTEHEFFVIISNFSIKNLYKINKDFIILFLHL